MRVLYKDHEIEVRREDCLAGYPLLYFTITRKTDEYICLDSFEDSDETIWDKIRQLKGLIDGELEEDDPWEEKASRDDVPSTHRERCWEDLHMQDISAGPVQPREAFDHGYNSAMTRCADAVQTCRAIAEGAGIWGDPEKYSEYVRTMARIAIEELTNPDGTPNP